MPASVEILPIPLGSQFVKENLGPNDPEDINDFRCLVIFSENVTFGASDINISAEDESGSDETSEVILLDFEGSNAVYLVTLRPPPKNLSGRNQTTLITLTVPANAVSEGNTATTKTIRCSTRFPDGDAETPTSLFTHNISNLAGIALTPTRILIVSKPSSLMTLRFFTHSGTLQTGETATLNITESPDSIDVINGDILAGGRSTNSPKRFRVDGTSLIEVESYSQLASQFMRGMVHCRLGLVRIDTANDRVLTLPYGKTTVVEHDMAIDADYQAVAHQNDLLYFAISANSFPNLGLAEITGDDINFITQINVNITSADGFNIQDISLYRDTLYLINQESGSFFDNDVYTLDIRKYRPLEKNTKTTIPVQFANEGDTIDLTQFSPDAERIVPDVGFDKPSFLTFNASNQLVIAANAVTETTPVYIPLKGINRIDATETRSFGFYLIIEQATDPVWRDVGSLTMRPDTTYDLFQIVEGAETIEYRSGRPQLAGSRLSDGKFRIGTTGGTTYFTARKGSRTAHIEFNVDVVHPSNPDNFSDVFRHRVEIAGIDVSQDVREFPTVSKSLDVIALNEYRPNEVRLTLQSGSGNNYRYNDDIPGNFWETHGLNPGGFQVPIHIYIESFVDGNYISYLLFSGIIQDLNADIHLTHVELTCPDISTELEKTLVQDFGTLVKWDSLRQKSDESNFQGVYTPESSLLPMQIGNNEAWSHLIRLMMRELALPSEGQPIRDSAYLTPQELFTSGGLLDHNPILRFKTQHRSEDVRFLINQIAVNKKVYNAEINLIPVSLTEPFLLNRGNIPFSVENTRTTRNVTDWVQDPSNDRILMLLSNSESHIYDLLVQYDLNGDSYRVLHTFDKDTAVHRIERRNGSNYYILTSAKIQQDRSARQLPRVNDSTGYAYDSLAEGSEIKIYHYSTSTGTLTEHVAEDDTYPPQLGIFYHVGFENDLYIDEHEGLRPDYRGAFKWQGSYLYYRYAKDGEFGVARVNTSGTTTKMIGQAAGKYQNHLNSAFDINSAGTLYFVYVTGDENTSSFVIKRRTSGGTQSTILTDIRGLAAFSDIHPEFGAYLGVHEVLFHANHLYILAPMQSADFGDDVTNTAADPNFIIEIEDTGMSGERYVTTSTNLNPTSTRLAPGDDIPIRIDFNSTVSGATQSDLTVYGGTIQSFSISSDMIDVTIRPDDLTRHLNIVIDLAENAVTQRNEATRIIVDFGTRRSRTKTGGGVLYRCNVNAGSPSLTAIETWDYATHGGVNLTIHDGSVHFVEHPPASAIVKPINQDLDGYFADAERKQTMGYNVLPDPLGTLKKVNSNGEVESLGNLWHEERPYNVAATRCLAFDDELHLVIGYGSPDEILRYNSLASKPDNFQHLVYGKKLHYVLPEFNSNQNRYTLLADIAKKTNATLSFQSGLISIRDRDPFRATTDGNTGTGTGHLNFDKQNKPFPNVGYLLIEKEIFQYTGITSGAFTGIQRGVLGTQITNHPNNTPILYLDTLIEESRIRGRFSISTDSTRTRNVIRNNENTIEVADPDSIRAYNELPYSLDLGLTQHDLAWQEHIFKNYLENLKDPHPLINLTLEPSFYLDLEQFVGFRYNMLVYGVQIVSITYSKDSTTIQGRVL